MLAGCVSLLPDHPTWNGPLCETSVRPVKTSDDETLSRVFDAVLDIARADLPRRPDSDAPAVTIALVAVERPWSDRFRLATVCVRGSLVSIMVNANAFPVLLQDRGGPLARVLAHEVAHVTLRHTPGAHAPTAELEADTLGAYYAELAGFPCRRSAAWGVQGWAVRQWPDQAEYRAAVQAACAAAERGVRPPRRL